MFNPHVLAAELHPRQVRYFPQIASTNDLALTLLNQNAPNGTIVIADEQTKGRGRLGRTWYAMPGTSLLFTVIFRLPQSSLPRLTMLGGLAVCETLQQMAIQDVGIKWANDVQIRGRKVAGVLPEAAWDGGTLAGAILGIGVNVTVDFANSPFRDTAISVQDVSDTPLDRLDLLKRILARLDAWADRLESDRLFEAWRDNLNMIGQYVTVEGRRCKAVRVDTDGALVISDENGVLQRVLAGDILLG